MANFRNEYKELKAEAKQQDASLPNNKEQSRDDIKAELQAQLSGLIKQMQAVAKDISNDWHWYSMSTGILHEYAPNGVYQKQERLKAMHFEAKSIRLELARSYD